jgi:predicted amidohydrolase YtcJ
MLQDVNQGPKQRFGVHKSRRFNVQILLALLILGCSTAKQRTADTIVINARIWTGEASQPTATSMAIVADTIAAIGSVEDITKWKGGNTKIVDAQGKMLVPGFIDSHVHFIPAGFTLLTLKLRGCASRQEFVDKVAAYVANKPKGAWIQGGEWDQTIIGATPDKSWIDAVTPDNPVFLNRMDVHQALVNSTALRLAGIDRNTKDPEGGQIGRDANGEPTGILKDNAMNLVQKLLPQPTAIELDVALDTAMRFVASKGVTSVHHMAGLELDGEWEAYERARQNGRLSTRVYLYSALKDVHTLKEKVQKQGRGDAWIQIGGLKGFMDGSLGSHTAAFSEPYSDHHMDHGIYVTPKDSVWAWVRAADQAGLQVTLHAIGDAANHFALDVYEAIKKENPARDRRFRVEHAQHILPEDIVRFAQNEVIASVQPYHAIDDGRWAEKVIGAERLKTTHAYKSLIDAGATVVFGSDWYVAPPTPLEGIYAAVTRRTLDDKNPDGWIPDQKITVEQALHAYTTKAAFAGFEENRKGSLKVGKLADFVLLSEDLFAISPVQIRDVLILQTWVGGKRVY